MHAHSWLLYSLLPLLPSPETRLVVWVHDQGFICPKTTFVYRGGVCMGPEYAKCVGCAEEQYGALRSLALTSGLTGMKPWRGRVDRYVANSHVTAGASAGLIGRGTGAMEVIPPFVSDEAFHAAKGDVLRSYRLRATTSCSRVRSVHTRASTSCWRHGPDSSPSYRWWWPGYGGPIRPALPRGVIVAEEVPHEDVLRAWGHCIAAVVPSVWPEPFGMVALEAMAAGRPVVASAVGGLADLVVDGITGILVPPGDASALRSAIQALLAEPLLRARMGAAGRKRAAAYSANVVVAAWERVFREVIAGRGGRDRVKTASVTVNWGSPRDTLAALRSLESMTTPPDLIICVDNGSSAEHVSDCGWARRRAPF